MIAVSTALQPGCPDIAPLRYHRALLAYLRSEEREIWDWIASQQVRAEYADSIRHELLKSTYRLGRDSAGNVYQAAETVAERLAYRAPITLYQAQNATGLNASLAWLPEEVHVVLHGPVQDTLSDAELIALFGHEIAHHLLLSLEDGAYLVAEQVLTAMLGDRASSPAHQQTWKHFKLYTELYCDRLTLNVSGDLAACVATLVKMETGLRDVSGDEYLKQAEEIFSRGSTTSDGLTHPEMFIRARALALWAEDPDQVDGALETIIEGPLAIGKLDVLRQKRMSQATRALLAHFLAPGWIRTAAVLAHARQFFDDFDRAPVAARDDNECLDELKAQIAFGDDQLRDYFCYVLLDFVTSDADLEEAPLAAALVLVQKLGIDDRFTTIVARELRLSKRQFDAIRKNAAAIIAEAEKRPAD
jgi:hypothetical protein